MLHGRSGAYSSRARGVYDGTTLSSRNRWWGELFAQQGYAALIVDDFSALGYPSGFPAGSYRKRPADVSEVYRRPLHAYGALVYLQSRPEIDGEQIGLIGWSNGGTAALAAIADDLYGGYSKHRFKAAVAMYPGCGFQQELKGRPYRSSAPVRILIGNADTEVSAATCTKLVSESRIADKAFSLTTYEGAQHGFDTPVRTVQNLLANSEARKDAIRVVLHFFDMHLTST
jgi:carboxymethylenebutenolidase